MAFCDFCSCDDCKFGATDLYHAECIDGRWICDICFTYDLCTSPKFKCSVPCENKECEHRPKLKTKEWLKL